MNQSIDPSILPQSISNLIRWKISWLVWLLLLFLSFNRDLFKSDYSSLFVISSKQDTPATYYGVIRSDIAVPAFVPKAGMLVKAFIAETLCGTTQTQQSGIEIVYRIEVLAENEPGGVPQCGTPGAIVTFNIDSQLMAPTASWDNSQVWQIPLHPVLATPTATKTPTPIGALPTLTSTAKTTPTPTGILPTLTSTAMTTPTPTGTLPTLTSTAMTTLTPTGALPTFTPTAAKTPTPTITPQSTSTLSPNRLFMPLIHKNG